MYIRTMSPRRTRGALFPLSAASALLGLALASGCDPTVVSAIEEARQASSEKDHDDGADARKHECLVALVYRVENDLFYSQPGGGIQTIDPIGGGGVGGVGGTGGASTNPPLGATQQLYGTDGFARLTWEGEVVAELIIDKAFLESGRVEVLAYEAPDGVRYEYHVYTRPACSDAFPPSAAMTREEVEALEGG